MRLTFVCLFFFSIQLAVFANETYSFRLYQPQQGHLFLVKKSFLTKHTLKAGAFSQEQSQQEEMEYQVKILKVEQKIAKEVEISFPQLVKRTRIQGSQREENPPVKGVRVKLIYLKKGAPPKLQILKGKLSPSLQKKLSSFFQYPPGYWDGENQSKILPSLSLLFAPKKAVRIGENWSLDIEKFLNLEVMKVSAEIDKSKSKQRAKILRLIQSPFGTFAEYLTEAEIFIRKMRDLPGFSGKLRTKVKGLATTDGKHPEKRFDILAEMSLEGKVKGRRLKILSTLHGKIQVERLE